MKLFGHRVVATTSPRMTSQDATTSEIETFERSMLLDGINRILGAGGSESTRWWQQWRNACPIEIDGEQKDI